MGKNTWVVGSLALAFAACNTPPPQAWLRLEPDGAHNWAGSPQGLWVARMHGADVTLDLNRTQTRIEVVVTNRSGAPVAVCMGAEAARPTGAVGDVLLRPLEGIGGPDALPYNTMQKTVVETGWRGTFDINSPLGRDPVLGSYFVFTVEVRNGAGDVERRSIPLKATNSGTVPLGRR